MQNQSGFSDRLAIAAPVGGTEPDQIVTVGDTIGFAYDGVSEGQRVILAIRGEFGTKSVVAKEVWSVGERVFWHPLIGRFTKRVTHWPAGRIAEDKAADVDYGLIHLDSPVQAPGEVIAPFNFEHVPTFGVLGDYVLRDFGGPARIVQGEVVSNGLAPGTVTVSLGDGTGNNDQIFAATDASALAGFDEIPDLPVSVDKVVLRIGGVGAFTAGLLIVRLSYVPAA